FPSPVSCLFQLPVFQSCSCLFQPEPALCFHSCFGLFQPELVLYFPVLFLPLLQP
ncbi:hypothetical protein NDU88_010448, partial [Pleurodeles waltl]